MRRTSIGIVASLATAALLLTGCSGGSGASSGEKGDTLTIGATLDMYGWSPVDQPGYQNWATDAVYERLVRCNSVGELEPAVAESWEISAGNDSITAKIRSGEKFSDGTPVDSAAVKASFEYNVNNGGATADYKGITIDTPDASTVTITWPEPQATLRSKLCNPYIVSPKWLSAGKFDSPVGSGPYTLDTKGTTTGSVYAFTKNEQYWDTTSFPFKKVVVKVLENDAAAVSALKTGQIDATLVGNTSVAEVKGSNMDIKAFKGQTTRLILSDHLGAVIPALGDLRVRQAMNMVFDKEAMVKSLYLGNGEPAAQVFREGTPAFIDDLKDPYPFDVDKAKALMAEAGYADGFALELPTMDGQNFETLMPYVKQQLALINISVTEAPLSGANAIGDLLSGKYPVVLWQLGNLGDSVQQIYVESTPDGYWDLQHQPDEYVDSRYAKLATATPEESKQLQQEINQYIVDQAWFAPMVFTGSNFAFNPDKVSIPTESDPEALTPRLRDFK
ncbi:hypothetical protein KXS11_05930 [Plantibacter flavus]|uniref:ABC transporter substrate-binding protein n=1 Tax=Plantibacter flavus TaxID=150123 RepID=UPI003F1892E7